jgi:hypothetical protein
MTNLAIRTVVGLLIVGATEFLGKITFYSILCRLFNADADKMKKMKNSVNNRVKNTIDLTCKFFTYSLLGFNAIFVCAQVFKYLNIQRDSFYSEI